MSKKYKLLLTGSFHKEVEIEADSPGDAMERMWAGEIYENRTDWEFDELTYAEGQGESEVVDGPAPAAQMFEVAR